MSETMDIIESEYTRQKLTELRVSKMETGIKSLNDKMDETNKTIGKMSDSFDEILNGDYKTKGLVSTVREHDEYIRECKENMRDDKKDKRAWVRWILETVICLILGYIAYKINLLPILGGMK